MKTLFIGQNAIFLKSVDSTNSYATELLRQNKVSEGTIIYSFEQTNGRGQRGNSWESEPNKNVAFSAILQPHFLTADKQYLLTKITALAVTDLMAEVLKSSIPKERIEIKWPNDIYINEKKIGGILIENSLRDTHIQNSIIGIGININQIDFKTTTNSTSLALLTNKEFDLAETIELLCSFIEARYLQLKANKIASIDNDYFQHLYRLNSWNMFSANNQLFEGKIAGVSESGKLRVQLRNEEIKEFDLKEIVFI